MVVVWLVLLAPRKPLTFVELPGGDSLNGVFLVQAQTMVWALAGVVPQIHWIVGVSAGFACGVQGLLQQQEHHLQRHLICCVQPGID